MPAAGATEAMTRELEQARAEADRFRSLFDHHPDAAFTLDPAGVLAAVNAACTELTGLGPAQLLGTPFAALVAPEGRELTARRMAAALAGAPQVWDADVLHANGRRSCAQLTAIPMVIDGRVCGVHGIAKDVTIHRVMEEQLAHQAFHDALTGLANRVLFRERVERALLRAARAREGGAAEHVAVVFLDLDDFKAVNDSLGHAEGDRLLEAVAGRLLKATRGCDTVARLGGDEFAVLLDGMAARDDAGAVVQRITSALRAPVALTAKEVTASCSLGLAHATPGDGPDELLRNADVAMYRAKAAGKSRHAVFEPAMHAAVLERVELEADLRRAVERGELTLVYQPLVELATGRLLSFEALVRWHHPRRGLVAPALFVPLAEDTGLIAGVGRWVLRAACAQLAAWAAEPGLADVGVGVNVSGRQIDDPGFVADVAAVLAETGLAPARLTLEITESVIMREPDATLERLHALKALGVRLAIDDFGTGYSSLSYLQRFPVDALKIDKSFVDGVGRGGSDAALARTIVALAEMLRIRSVAEGIERADQRAQLAALGCDVGQGYLFARPLAPDDAVRLFGAARPAAP